MQQHSVRLQAPYDIYWSCGALLHLSVRNVWTRVFSASKASDHQTKQLHLVETATGDDVGVDSSEFSITPKPNGLYVSKKRYVLFYLEMPA